MPELPISDGEGNLVATSRAEILAATIYPDLDDEQRRKEFLASVITRVILDNPDARDVLKHSDLIELLAVVSDLPTPKEHGRRASRYWGNSWIAGEMLLLLLTGALHHPELEVNITKCVYLIREIFSDYVTPSGKSRTLAERTIWKAWTTFKPSAHFHAIRQMCDNPEINLGNFFDLLTGDTLGFLSLSEKIRTAAIRHGFLKHKDTWFPPPDLKLPDSSFFTLLPLPREKTVKILESYVPPHSKDAGLDDL